MSAIVRANNLQDNAPRTVTVAINTDVSGPIHIAEYAAGSIATPAAFTSSGLLFECSLDGTQWMTVKNEDGTADSSVTVTTSSNYTIPAACFSYPFMRLKLGSTEAAARTIKYFLKG